MRYYNTIYSFILEYKNPNVAFYLRDFTTHVMPILDRKALIYLSSDLPLSESFHFGI